MLEGDMQEGRPDDPGQTAQMTGYDAIPVKVAIPNQIINHKDQPAKRCDCDDRGEASEQGLRCVAISGGFIEGLQFHPRVVLGCAEHFGNYKIRSLLERAAIGKTLRPGQEMVGAEGFEPPTYSV